MCPGIFPTRINRSLESQLRCGVETSLKCQALTPLSQLTILLVGVHIVSDRLRKNWSLSLFHWKSSLSMYICMNYVVHAKIKTVTHINTLYMKFIEETSCVLYWKVTSNIIYPELQNDWRKFVVLRKGDKQCHIFWIAELLEKILCVLFQKMWQAISHILNSRITNKNSTCSAQEMWQVAPYILTCRITEDYFICSALENVASNSTYSEQQS